MVTGLGVILMPSVSFVDNIVFHNKKAYRGKLTYLSGVPRRQPADAAALAESLDAR